MGGTYKEFFGTLAKGGLLGRVLHLGRHIDVYELLGSTGILLRLLVEFRLKSGEEGVARHRSTVGTCRRRDGGRREGANCFVAKRIVGGEGNGETGGGAPVCR